MSAVNTWASTGGKRTHSPVFLRQIKTEVLASVIQLISNEVLLNCNQPTSVFCWSSFITEGNGVITEHVRGSSTKFKNTVKQFRVHNRFSFFVVFFLCLRKPMRRLIVTDCLHCVLIKRECAGLLLYICIVRLFTILCEIYILVCNLHSCVKFTRIYVSHAFPTFCLVYGVFSQSRQATAF